MQESKLYVGNLTYSVTNEELKELFSSYGDVQDVKVIEGKGFGFVEMSSPEEAQRAQETLNQQDFKGRPLRIDKARPPKPRDNRERRGGSGGGGFQGRGNGGGGFRRY